MFMRKIIFFLLLFHSINTIAQTEVEIRKHYQEVNKQISQSIVQGYEGPLYHNQWVVNKTGKSWPAVGLYADTTNFWYDDDPGHLSAADRNPKMVLLKVEVSTRRSADVMSGEEYLFKNGVLFFYYSYWGEENTATETRAYFSNRGVMFKNMVKVNGKELSIKELATGEQSDAKPNAKTILVAGKKYQELFVKQMVF